MPRHRLSPISIVAVGAIAWLTVAPVFLTEPALAAPVETEPSRALLAADVEWIQPGRPFRVGVLFQTRDRWHVYWTNPGDSGIPPQIEWHLPDGFTAGALQWPYPKRFDDPPFATFGHEGQLLLARELRPPERLETGTTVTLTADVDWLVCKGICVPQQARVSLDLDVRDEPSAPSAAWGKVFEDADARLPVADPEWGFRVAAAGSDYVLSVTPPSGVDAATVMAAEFFPAQVGFLRTGPYRWRRAGDVVQLPLVREGPVPAGNRLRGVLVLPAPAAGQGLPRAVVVEAALPGALERDR